MSANNKRARQLQTARAYSAERKNGRKGPAKTTPKHTKKKAWYQVGNARIVKQTEGGESVAFAITRPKAQPTSTEPKKEGKAKPARAKKEKAAA